MSDVNLLGPNLVISDTTPAAPSGNVLVKWQGNGQKISGYVATDAGGTVTSVGLSMPTEFSVSGSPVTGSGTLAVTKANETANTVWAGPSSGAAAQPTFRALTAADIPASSSISTNGTLVGTATNAPINVNGIAQP